MGWRVQMCKPVLHVIIGHVELQHRLQQGLKAALVSKEQPISSIRTDYHHLLIRSLQ